MPTSWEGAVVGEPNGRVCSQPLSRLSTPLGSTGKENRLFQFLKGITVAAEKRIGCKG